MSLSTNLQGDQYGGHGRPKHHVSRDQLHALSEDVGFSCNRVTLDALFVTRSWKKAYPFEQIMPV